METLFADYVETVTYKNGLVKVVLGNETVGMGSDDSQPEINSHTVLVMPASSFLNFYNSSGKLLEKMVAADVVKEKEIE